jgi:hypothetical protein
MSSLNFIGGEKGGVGKSVTARALAQYFLDKGQPFTGFDTDRSHHSFTRFYADYASPVVVDSFEGLDRIVEAFEVDMAQHVIVDLAAQTLQPLARWIKDSQLVELLSELGIAVNFWHVLDDGVDSVSLLQRLVDTFGVPANYQSGPNYIVVQNHGRGSDFSWLTHSPALATARGAGARMIVLPALQDLAMRKIDQQSASFWSAANNREGSDALGILERQRVKLWLQKTYSEFDSLPL